MFMDDLQFIEYWPQNREKEKSSARAFLLGLSSGFAIGVLVLIAIYSGWYPRATMEANSKMSSSILLIAIMGISIFIAIVYRRFKWEQQEQRYLELLAKKNKKHSMQP